MSWSLLMLFTEHAHFCHDWSSSANTKMTFTAAWQNIYQYRSSSENIEEAQIKGKFKGSNINSKENFTKKYYISLLSSYNKYASFLWNS